MKIIQVPYAPGDIVWSFYDKCIEIGEKITCPDCDNYHYHENKYKKVPARATISSVTVNGVGWVCEIHFQIGKNASSTEFRRECHIWTTQKKANAFCTKQNKIEGNEG